MSFQIHALPFSIFAPLFTLSDEELGRQKALRQIVQKKPGTPCRVSLQDTEPGETVLLLHHTHQPADTPFHASHAIYVRKGAIEAKPQPNEVPPMLRTRLLSLRAFDSTGIMLQADVAPGTEIEAMLETLFANPQTDTVHIHNARQGCYLARARRA